MNRYKLLKAGINAKEAIDRLNGNAELYEKILYNFPDDQSYSQLCIGLSNKDVKKSFNAAHALKGLAGNLSLKKLYEDIYPLVEILRNGSLENTDELLKNVSNDYEMIISVLSEKDKTIN